MPVTAAAAVARPACVPAPGPTSVHSIDLEPILPGDPLGALPDHWELLQDVAAPAPSPVHAIVVIKPGDALGLVVTRDTSNQRCILGTWALAFGGRGVDLKDLRVTRAHDGRVDIRLAFEGIYRDPVGTEPGAVELQTDGVSLAITREDGYRQD